VVLFQILLDGAEPHDEGPAKNAALVIPKDSHKRDLCGTWPNSDIKEMQNTSNTRCGKLNFRQNGNKASKVTGDFNRQN